MKKIMTMQGEVKSLGGQGYFAGYASMFDYVDNHMDVVIHGAFERTLLENKSGQEIKLLWQHDVCEPIGYFTSVKEDNHGLYVEGYLHQEVQKGREAYALLKSGAVKGLSIGYKVKDYSIDHKSGIRIINDLDLYEISLVTFPANEMAIVTEVKGDDFDEMPMLSVAIDNALLSLQ